MRNDISFAWRCWLIEPEDVPPHETWPDHNMRDQPRPPAKWRRQDFVRPWHSWRSAKRLSDNRVTARDAFSIVWCQRTQQYWVVPGDCTDRSEPGYTERYEKWKTLFCRHLQDSEKPGLWELLDHAIVRQHDSRCPKDFDEFLPKNFFMGIGSEEACHFVGHLSLVLGLLAMCPSEVKNIPRQIDTIFYHKNEPRFIPWWKCTKDHTDNSPDRPMDRYSRLPISAYFLLDLDKMILTGLAHPGRAIVMQTGVIKNDVTSREDWLRAWERGDMGPMVSSKNPTETDKQAWGIRPSGY